MVLANPVLLLIMAYYKTRLQQSFPACITFPVQFYISLGFVSTACPHLTFN